MKTKLVLNVAIFVDVPDGERYFLGLHFGKKIKRRVVEVEFEQTFLEQVQLGSKMSFSVWRTEPDRVSTIIMSPINVVKEDGERIQKVHAKLSTVGEYRFIGRPSTIETATTDLTGFVTELMASQGFTRVGDVTVRDMTWKEKEERASPFVSTN